MRLLILSIQLAILLSSLNVAFGQDDIFENYDDTPLKVKAKKTKEQLDKEKLDAFFKELEGIALGKDERSKILAKMLADFQAEFRKNEPMLKNAKHDAEIHDRQLLLAQYHIELMKRKQQDSASSHTRMNAIQERTRQFKRENPTLGRKTEFSRRESEIRRMAMAGNRIGHSSSSSNNVLSTMRKLSADGQVFDRYAPTHSRTHPGAAKGTLNQYYFTLRRLLRLRWDGPNLQLDREHWTDAFAGRTPQDITRDIDAMFESQGVSPYANEDQRRRAAQAAQQQNIPGRSGHPNLNRLLQEFYMHSNYSFRGGQANWMIQTADLAARMNVDAVNFDFSISEAAHPSRVMRIRASRDSLSIVLLGDLIYRYEQRLSKSNPLVTVTEISGDEVIGHSATSFAELYRKHPRYVEDRFLPLLENMGVVPPHFRFDEPIMDRVVELIKSDQPAIRKEFDAIFADLDVDQFTRREAAYKKLRQDLGKFYGFLFEAYQRDDLSSEAKARIGKLVELGRAEGTADLDETISALKLTEDEEYLRELADAVTPEQKAILKTRIRD